VASVDRRVGGQPAQLAEGVPHHLVGSLEDAAAAHGKQRVADESDLGLGNEIRDVPKRVAGRLDHAHLEIGEAELVALADLAIDAGDFCGFATRTDDLAACLGLERGIALRMVLVVMGCEDVCELPALFRESCLDGGYLGRVDRGRHAGFGVVDEHPVIVGACGKLVNFQGHGVLLFGNFDPRRCRTAAPLGLWCFDFAVGGACIPSRERASQSNRTLE